MPFATFTRETRFRDLVESVQYCTLCPRLCSRRKVLSEANGYIGSKVLFVAEAPGRLGADRTGIPLHGDRTGDNFETLLGNVGWRRESVFVTNAVLCNPREENGNNGTPTAEEILNCSAYLRMVIELIQPSVIVTLGATALKALDTIVPHGTTLADGVAKPVLWSGRVMFPLYHPGPRALVHRALAKQRSDFIKLAKLADPAGGIKPVKSVRFVPDVLSEPSPFQQAVMAMTQATGPVTWFKLTKLLYLADLRSLEKHGHTITGEVYLRQAAGPWAPQLKKDLHAMNGHEVRVFQRAQTPVVTTGPSPRFPLALPDEAAGVILDVAGKYGNMTESDIKTAVYMTRPMRHVLREEKKGRKMTNVAVLYKNSTIIDAGHSGQVFTVDSAEKGHVDKARDALSPHRSAGRNETLEV